MDKVNGAAPEPKVMAKIVIELTDNGQISINGPDDLVLFYGMMEIGRDIMRDKHQQATRIQLAPPAPLLNRMMRAIKPRR